MKKLLTLMLALVLMVSLTGCADYASNTPTGDEGHDVTETPTEGSGDIDGLGIYYVQHISGEGHEVSRPVKVLFEFKTLKFTKYQIAYLSCT